MRKITISSPSEAANALNDRQLDLITPLLQFVQISLQKTTQNTFSSPSDAANALIGRQLDLIPALVQCAGQPA
jgi:hypothetical protein